MGKCKLCGRLEGEVKLEKVRLGGSCRNVCTSCSDREIPMMDLAPGRRIQQPERTGLHVIRVEESTEIERVAG